MPGGKERSEKLLVVYFGAAVARVNVTPLAIKEWGCTSSEFVPDVEASAYWKSEEREKGFNIEGLYLQLS
jgi:hypothetical protein